MQSFFSRESEIEPKPVTVPGSKLAFIQWLTTSEHGSKEYALRRFTIAPGGVIAMHSHHYEETVYVLNGRVRVCVGPAKSTLGPGEYVYVDGDVPHALTNEGENEVEFLCVIPYLQDMAIRAIEGSC
jgi:quercetin dioxygenase-like cupin family protein